MAELGLEDWLTIAEAVQLGPYREQYLRRLAREGRLKIRRVGRMFLIERQDFLDYRARMSEMGTAKFNPHSGQKTGSGTAKKKAKP